MCAALAPPQRRPTLRARRLDVADHMATIRPSSHRLRSRAGDDGKRAKSSGKTDFVATRRRDQARVHRRRSRSATGESASTPSALRRWSEISRAEDRPQTLTIDDESDGCARLCVLALGEVATRALIESRIIPGSLPRPA
jgi:hypothetical protein